MSITIIQYNAGNTRSVYNALKRLGADVCISNDPDQILAADKVIFPGVGAAAPAMDYLRTSGLDQVLVSLQQPVLGICLGMQLLCSYSEEGATQCLGIFGQQVRKFVGRLKVPHTGWNTLGNLQSPLFKGITADAYVYYVHSYYVQEGPHTIAVTDYIQPYSAALQKDNFYGLQFHPEKSGVTGAQILQNFIEL